MKTKDILTEILFTCATTIDVLKTIVEKCQERKDDWGREVEIRLSCSHDLVAGEGVYHEECFTRLMSNRSKTSDNSDVVCFRDIAKYILSEAWHNSRKEDKNEDAKRIITAAAKFIRTDIRQNKYDMDYYQLTMTLSVRKKKDCFLKTLKCF